MVNEVTAIYENGMLCLLTPLSLPELTRVRVQILTEEESRDDLRRAEAALVAAGLVKPAAAEPSPVHVSKARRKELRRLYAAGEPLSETIVQERDPTPDRVLHSQAKKYGPDCQCKRYGPKGT